MSKFDRNKIQDIYPLTPLQEGMLFHNLVDSDKNDYFLQYIFDIDGEVSEDVIKDSLQLLSEKYEVLRTVFLYQELEEPLQIVLTEREIEFSKVDLQKAEDKDKQLNEIKRNDIERGFDLQNDTLLRVKLVRLNAEQYKIIWSIHHIIIDGWSSPIVIGEFSRIYNRLLNGENKESIKDEFLREKEGRLTYGDYVQSICGQAKDESLKYWRDLLEDYEETADIIPYSKVEQTNKTVNLETLSIDENLSNKIVDIAKKCGVTINTVVEAAYGILLQQCNGCHDVVFGKVVSGREKEFDGIEEMVGLFINTIPIRVKSDSDMTVTEQIKDLMNQSLESRRYDYCGLNEIQDYAEVSGDFIKTLFVFENYFIDDENFKQEKQKVKFKVESVREETNYDFNVMASYFDNLNISVSYNPNKYSLQEIRSYLKKMKLILEKIAENPDRKIEELEIVLEEERDLIINKFNDTFSGCNCEKTVIDLFEEQVKARPDNIAVVYENKNITYAELNQRANQVALRLGSMGIGVDDLVVVMAEKSIDTIVAICGILKSGAAYVPIDPLYPKERIDYIIKDCKPKAVIVHEDFADSGINTMNIKDDDIYHDQCVDIQVLNKPGDPAYIIYTSGTTGMPKGVIINHKGIVRLVHHSNYIDLNENTVILQTGTLSFDAATFEIWGALLNGGQLHLANIDVIMDFKKLKEIINKEQINTIWLTVSLFNQLINDDVTVFDNLQRLLIGGEKLSETHVRKLLEHNKNIDLVNGYGPTENTTFTTCYHIKLDTLVKNIPIGKPITGTKIYVLNGMKLCGIGIPGELCTAGYGVANGYLNREEFTSEKFINDSYGQGKMYRTGDLVRWLPDGNIEYLGRIDEQVKIRGFRIELGEIRSVLLKLKDIKDAAVIVREDSSGEKAIYAYVISDSAVDCKKIRNDMSEQVPAYMIPAYIMQIEKIPVTRNGKLDKKMLPDIVLDNREEYVAPRNETEEVIVKIFTEILGRENISVTDDFFLIGGHSLRATRAANRIEAETGVRIPVKVVLSERTAEKLAKYVEKSEGNQYEDIPKAVEKQYYPMSSTQRRLYLIWQMNEQSTAYNMPICYKMSGNVRPDKIRKSLERIIDRHEVLRTCFMIQDGELVQRVLDKIEADYSYEESTQKEEDIIKDFIKPFSLSAGNLVRMKVVRCKENYYLLIDMHHIVSDGMSMGIFMREFSSIYNEEELEEVKLQYKDYSEWMGVRDLKEQEEYWVNQFNDEIPVLDMPLDYRRPQEKTYRGDVVTCDTQHMLWNKIKDMAHETETTEYMIFLSGIMILLSKYSGQEDIIIGSPISGRSHKDTENILGMFANTLAMRGKPEGRKTYRQFLNEIKEICLRAYENQEYPFEELVDSVNVLRDISRNPLFDVMLALQNNENSEFKLNEVKLKYIESKTRISKFDLNFNVIEDKEDFNIILEYCTDIFSKQTIEKILANLITILDKVTFKNDIKLSEIEMIAEQDKNEILIPYNDTNEEFQLKTLHGMFIEQAKKTPDKTAVKCGDMTISYKELVQTSRDVAGYLYKIGIKPGNTVGIIGERSIKTIINIIGTLMAGGIYVPINPNEAQLRKEQIIESSNCITVLDSSTKIDITSSEDESLEFKVADDINSIAYVIYTSGTTGTPKGVAIKHCSAANTILDINNKFKVTEKDCIIGLSAYNFDLSVYDIFGALSTGAELIIVKDQRDTEEIKTILENENITIWNSVPAIMDMFVESMHKGYTNESLRAVLLSGDWIALSLPERIKKCFNNSRTVSLGGATEGSIWSIYYPIEEVKKTWTSIPYGMPLANQKMYILDKYLNQCPIGIKGEICIGGVGVAECYFNNKEITDKAFIYHHKYGRIYRTGDVGKMTRAGYIEFLGRMDEQVKIKGFRIEIGEVESAFCKLPYINDAAAVIRKDSIGQKAIFAYLVSDKSLSINNIKKEIKKILPEYMIPAYIMQIDSMPVTRNGKVNKKELPEIKVKSEYEYTAPRNTTEKDLCEIFESILQIKKVGIKDNFFELGGDSLKATKLINQIESKIGTRIPLKYVFSEKTAEGLSEYIRTTGANEHDSIPKALEKEYYEMSSTQRRLYLMWKMDEESTAYNMPVLYRIKGELDPNKIRSALSEIIKRHEILRTAFLMKDGKLVQKICKDIKADFEYEETLNVEEAISNFIKPFRLERANSIRTKVVKGKNECYLFIDMHHIVGDGISEGIFMNELSELYKNKDLEEVKLQYKDYSEWMQKRDLGNQKSYWLSQFKEPVSITDLPYDYKRPKNQSYKGALIDSQIPMDLKERILKLCKDTGTTEYMVFLAAFMVVLKKYSGQEDIVVGSPISGRAHSDLENIMGMFVNTLALRGKPESGKKFIEFLDEIKGSCLKAYENQEYPFEELVEEVEEKRDLSRNPLFDVMFVLQNNEQAEFLINDIPAESLMGQHDISKFDLTINMAANKDGYYLGAEYCTELFKEDTIKRFLQHFKEAVLSIVENPQSTIGELNIISNEERGMLLDKFNNTYVKLPENKSIVEVFEEQVRNIPNNIAVLYKDKSLSYQELNEKANQIARLLVKRNVTSNTIVGIMLNRSVEMIAAILAVIKAGAAYLPIDPEYPAERIDYIIEDSGTNIIITEDALKHKINNDKEIVNINDNLIGSQEKSNLNISRKLNDMVYIIYTSGSTGRPKGVVLEDHGLLNLSFMFKNKLEINQSDNIIQFASISFDAAVSEVFMALLNGAKLCIPDKETILNMAYMQKYIKERKISIATLPPIYAWDLIRDYGVKINKLITAGSEAIKSMIDSYDKNLKYINAYGPTENTVCSTMWEIQKYNGELIPIGKPVDNVRIYILDKNNNLQPVGIAGEICIAGEGLAREYLNRPDLNAEKFIENPFKNGEKLYKTGDLGKWSVDGNIEFLGRIDNQVKVRGYRIELSEIENVLLRNNNIKNATVIDRNDTDGNKYLCAYVVCRDDISIESIREELKTHLPAYMIPTYIIAVNSIPLNRNGKVDKNLLPEPDKKIHSISEYEKPQTESERIIAQVWEEVLHINNIGVNESFFDLGGDSIKAIRIISRLVTNFEIKINDIFECENIKNLASKVVLKEDNLKQKIEELKEVAATLSSQEEYDDETIDNKKAKEIEEYNSLNESYCNMDISEETKYKNVLLTGATGYLGIHVLRELLKNNGSNIYVIIRAKNKEEAEKRLIKTYAFYFEDSISESINKRIVVLNGDLTLEKFGLDLDKYKYLENSIDCILNCAANVKHYGKYEEFYNANVNVVKQIVQFARSGIQKDINHISTVSVSGAMDCSKHKLFTEYSEDIEGSCDNYYIETKVLAERYIIEARKYGLNTNIFRMGNLVFDSENGVFQKNIDQNAFYLQLKASIDLGLMPEKGMGYDFSFVDYAGRAIRLLYNRRNLNNQIYHIFNPNFVTVEELGKLLIENKVPLNMVSYENFLDYIYENYNKKELRECINNFITHSQILENTQTSYCINMCEKTTLLLEKLGFAWSKLETKHIEKMIRYCEKTGFIKNKQL